MSDPGPFVTKTGKVLTDADIQALADEAEAGYDVSHLKERKDRVRPFVCYAWIGEDEFGSGEVGLKAGNVPAGYIPLVSTEVEKLERPDLVTQGQSIVDTYGKVWRLVRLEATEELRRLEPSKGLA